MAKKPKVRKAQLGRVISHAVVLAEELFPATKNGAIKKEWVVDFVNDKINIPILTERQEKNLLEILIDVVCGLTFNKK